jgi:hypothetical protein
MARRRPSCLELVTTFALASTELGGVSGSAQKFNTAFFHSANPDNNGSMPNKKRSSSSRQRSQYSIVPTNKDDIPAPKTANKTSFICSSVKMTAFRGQI